MRNIGLTPMKYLCAEGTRGATHRPTGAREAAACSPLPREHVRIGGRAVELGVVRAEPPLPYGGAQPVGRRERVPARRHGTPDGVFQGDEGSRCVFSTMGLYDGLVQLVRSSSAS